MESKRENLKFLTKTYNRHQNINKHYPNAQTSLFPKEAYARKERPVDIDKKTALHLKPKIQGKDPINETTDYTSKVKEYRAKQKNSKLKLGGSIPDKAAMDSLMRRNSSIDNIKSRPMSPGNMNASTDNKKSKKSSDHYNWLSSLKQNCQRKLENDNVIATQPSKLFNFMKPAPHKSKNEISCKLKTKREDKNSNAITNNNDRSKPNANGYQIDFCEVENDSIESIEQYDQTKLNDTKKEAGWMKDQSTLDMRKQIFGVIKEETREKNEANLSKKPSKHAIKLKKPDEANSYKTKNQNNVVKTDTQTTLGGYRARFTPQQPPNTTKAVPFKKLAFTNKPANTRNKPRVSGTRNNTANNFIKQRLENVGASIKQFKLETDNKYLNFKVNSDNNFQELLNLKKYLDSNVKLNEKRLMAQEEQRSIIIRTNENACEIKNLEAIMESLNQKMDLNNEVVRLNNKKAEIDAEIEKLKMELHDLLELGDEMVTRKAAIEREIDESQLDIDRKTDILDDIIKANCRNYDNLIKALDTEEIKDMFSSSDFNKDGYTKNIESANCKQFKACIDEQMKELLQYEYEDPSEFAEQTIAHLEEISEQYQFRIKELNSDLMNSLNLAPRIFEMINEYLQSTNQALANYCHIFREKFTQEITFDKLTTELEELDNLITNNKKAIDELTQKEDNLSRESSLLAAQKMDLKWHNQNLGESKNFDELFNVTRINSYDQNLIHNGELVECNLQDLQNRVEKDRKKLEYIKAKSEVLEKLFEDNKSLIHQLSNDCYTNLDEENNVIESLLKVADDFKYRELKHKHERNFRFCVLLKTLMNENEANKVFFTAIHELRFKLKAIVDQEYGKIDKACKSRVSDKECSISKVTFSYKNSTKNKKYETLGSLSDTLNSGINELKSGKYHDILHRFNSGHTNFKSRK